MALDPTAETALKQGARAAAETVFVGGSHLLNGDIKRGGVYAALGLIARACLGVPGALAVAAASYVDASTGKTLPEQLGLNQPREKPESSASPPATRSQAKSA